MPDEKNNQKADKTTKLMFGVLAFLGMMTLILGILKIQTTIDLSNGAKNEESVVAGDNNSEPTLEDLKKIDSDHDGLSDFDELYVYNTSPYLADSDSDGYDDKTEIDGGFDPNCPKGQDCRGANQNQATEGSQQKTESSSTVGTVPSGQESANVLPTETQKQLNKLTPDEVRELLKKSGNLTPEQQAQIDQIDDTTLMQIFKETLNQ